VSLTPVNSHHLLMVFCGVYYGLRQQPTTPPRGQTRAKCSWCITSVLQLCVVGPTEWHSFTTRLHMHGGNRKSQKKHSYVSPKLNQFFYSPQLQKGRLMLFADKQTVPQTKLA